MANYSFHPIADISGKRFGRLTATKRAKNAACGATMWECQCDCGNSVTVQYSNLKRGATQSCGCLNRENLEKRNYKHGGSVRGKKERLYRVWRGMLDRCKEPSNNSFKYYGAKGVSVCEEWNDYAMFRSWSMENGYDESASRGMCTLDRINPFGNYEPENCRWVSMEVQNSNRRGSHEGVFKDSLPEKQSRLQAME